MTSAAVDTRVRSGLLSIQYLRAIAALMVVVHHAAHEAEGVDSPFADYHGLFSGVDIFFVISGFIMGVTAVGDRPRIFITKRLIRIVPLWWAALAAAVAIDVLLDGLGSLSDEDITSIVKSAFFIPHWSVWDAGAINPYLTPGWTLNYEMFFYALFAVGLLLGNPVRFACAAIPALIVAGIIFDPQGPVGITYTSNLMLEFLGGLVAAHVWRSRRWRRAVWPVMPLGFAGLLVAPLFPDDAQEPMRIVCAVAVVVGALALDDVVPEWRTLKLLGDSSYSIYLVHTVLPLPVALAIVRIVDLGGYAEAFLMIALTLVFSAIGGVLGYWIIEKPSLRFLRSRLLPARQPAAGQPVKTH